MFLNISCYSTELRTTATSNELPEYCYGGDIVTVNSKVDHENESSKTFIYRSKYVTKEEYSELPTIIVIPGGPGDVSIKEKPTFWEELKDESSNFEDLKYSPNILYTDPRTVGCNSSNNIANKYLTSRNVALDILTTIKDL